MTATQEPARIRIAGHDGVALNVWDYGGAGPTLLLCHCTGTTGRIWDPLVTHLRQSFHVYALDSRGHGDSDKPTEREAYTWENCGRDALKVAEHLNVAEGLFAAGHSGGGTHLVHAELLRPGTFRKMALLDAIVAPHAAFTGKNPMSRIAQRRRESFASRAEARAHFAAKPPMSAWNAAALDAYVAHGLEDRPDGRVWLKCPRRVEAYFYEMAPGCDAFEHIHEIAVPTLLVTAEHSNVGFLPRMQRERMPGAQMRVLPRASHFFPQEDPEATARILVEWMCGKAGRKDNKDIKDIKDSA
ncbi:MAG TPA: alpha/beta fold hydrolase [Candidatus Hydrogenedentes bacterium]|nr:alpha/beta fold hydrolase [Candidatus Hydrogenedentota bacterium]